MDKRLWVIETVAALWLTLYAVTILADIVIDYLSNDLSLNGLPL